jgi:hypothetical protein
MRIVKNFTAPRGRVHVRDLGTGRAAIQFAVAASVLLLLVHPVPGQSGTTRQLSQSRQDSSLWIKDWDCSFNGLISRKAYDNASVEQGIREARKLLQNCPTCRDVFGQVDPIRLLDRLNSLHAIFMSRQVLRNYEHTQAGALIVELRFQPKPDAHAVTQDISIKSLLEGRMLLSLPLRKPCIYVNPESDLFSAEPRANYGNLAQMRGIMILHELGHVAGSLPFDGGSQDLPKSKQNTACVMKNCLPCGERVMPCLETSGNSRRRRLNFTRKQQIIRTTRRQKRQVSGGG